MPEKEILNLTFKKSSLNYKPLIRHNLEYCCQVWSPKRRHGNWKTILDIEAVQRTFTRLVSGMSDLNYEQRLIMAQDFLIYLKGQKI